MRDDSVGGTAMGPADSPGQDTSSGGHRREWTIVVLLLMVHAGLLTYAGWRMSPTMDEPAHLAAGVSHWRFGRFALYAVNPPLVRLVAALPVLVVGYEEDWRHYDPRPAARSEFPVGRDFASVNGPRFFWLLTLGRWACIPFSLLGAVLCWRWANALFGPPCGLVALSLWCFSPNLIGHGALVTSDVAAASMGLAATGLYCRWLKAPNWPGALWAGCGLGLALLVKSTWVVLWVLWPILWMIHRRFARVAEATLRGRHSGLLPAACQLTGLLATSLYVLNAGYGFEGTAAPLGEYAFVSHTLRGDDDGPTPNTGNRWRSSLLQAVPVPLPANFLLGIDAQKRDFEQGRVKYLRGQLSADGWWYFYLYALLVKIPLGTWWLVLMSLCLLPRKPLPAADRLVLAVVPATLLLLVSAEQGLNYLRYLLPAFPYVFVMISRVGQALRSPGWRRVAVIAGLMGMVCGSLWTYPHSLSFFNAASGGTRHGYRHLVDSNFDWGQDLRELQQWLDEHPDVNSLRLAYFGLVDPQQVGIHYTLPPLDEPGAIGASTRFRPPPGWYAVSATYVYGGFSHIYDTDGNSILIAPGALGYFQHWQPVATAGTTLFIYHFE